MTTKFMEAMNKRPGFTIISDRLTIPYLTYIRTIIYRIG